MTAKKKALAGTMAVCLVLSGFALGRVTRVERVQADSSDSSSAAVTPPSGRALPSFASLTAQASPAVVHIKVVAVEKAMQPGPFGHQ